MNHYLRTHFPLLLILCLPLLHCASEPDKFIRGDDGAEMILIEGGTFAMGGRPEDLEGMAFKNYLNYVAEGPVHQVTISTFYLDKFETTNALYKRFLEDIAESGDLSMDHPDQPSNQDHSQRYSDEKLLDDAQPAVGLNWFDAYAYCQWAGKRLPTEAEWEYAARGAGDVYRKYPWGNEEPDAEGIWRANFRPLQGWDLDGYRHTSPVGSHPDGVSPFGVMDMAGNAEEWVQDWLDWGYYKSSEGAIDPPGPPSGKNKVIKGGSYGSDRYHIRIATRLIGPPHVKTEMQGFRCAMDVDD